MFNVFVDREGRMNANRNSQFYPARIDKIPSSVLYEHPYATHGGVVLFSGVFEVDVVHRLPDQSAASKWEVFYPWLYKVMSEGGGSRHFFLLLEKEIWIQSSFNQMRCPEFTRPSVGQTGNGFKHRDAEPKFNLMYGNYRWDLST